MLHQFVLRFSPLVSVLSYFSIGGGFITFGITIAYAPPNKNLTAKCIVTCPCNPQKTKGGGRATTQFEIRYQNKYLIYLHRTNKIILVPLANKQFGFAFILQCILFIQGYFIFQFMKLNLQLQMFLDGNP